MSVKGKELELVMVRGGHKKVMEGSLFYHHPFA
jgi:hypothetical protein